MSKTQLKLQKLIRVIRDFPIIKVSLTNKVMYAGAEWPSFIVRSGKLSGKVVFISWVFNILSICLGPKEYGKA